VGAVGTLLGEAGVNIAAMQVSRRDVGGEALMTMTDDTAVTPELLERAASVIGATAATAVDLTD
jgi:D-3-phosphoglycerate dehydrogenase